MINGENIFYLNSGIYTNVWMRGVCLKFSGIEICSAHTLTELKSVIFINIVDLPFNMV